MRNLPGIRFFIYVQLHVKSSFSAIWQSTSVDLAQPKRHRFVHIPYQQCPFQPIVPMMISFDLSMLTWTSVQCLFVALEWVATMCCSLSHSTSQPRIFTHMHIYAQIPLCHINQENYEFWCASFMQRSRTWCSSTLRWTTTFSHAILTPRSARGCSLHQTRPCERPWAGEVEWMLMCLGGSTC